MKYLNDISYKDCVGKVCKSKSSGDFKILKYNDRANVEIQFINTGFETTVQLVQVKSGSVKDPYSPSIYGVGIIGTKYPVSEGGSDTKDYSLWKSMLQRCYSNILKKRCPTYIGCEVSDKFKSYEYFYEWCHRQVGFGNKGWQLDKDLLSKECKIYSEHTCVFVPPEINGFLLNGNSYRGDLPLGVILDKGAKKPRYRARLSKYGKYYCYGSYSNPTDAFYAYKQAKEDFAKELAEKWKAQIDPRVYNALMNYQVEITD